MSDPKWVNVKTYSDPDGIYEGEIGRIEGVRFVETSEAKVFTHAGKDYETGTAASGTVTPKASARDVYSTLILGADAYGVTEITGGGLQHIVKQLGSAGTADPLDQRATGRLESHQGGRAPGGGVHGPHRDLLHLQQLITGAACFTAGGPTF